LLLMFTRALAMRALRNACTSKTRADFRRFRRACLRFKRLLLLHTANDMPVRIDD
jgi:hypothetical protein